MPTVLKKTVLITGCSTGGIGWAMAKVFRERDFYVFATLRDITKAGDLAELSDVEILELDVTIPETISRCRDIVENRTDGKLDLLINNAGSEFNCPLLDTDIAETKKQNDTTDREPLAMGQAFAPLLIAAKGVVTNHSSVASVLPIVWAGTLRLCFPLLVSPRSSTLLFLSSDSTELTRQLGTYASAKAAEARMSEVMRLELAPLGVRVVTLVLGSVATPLFGTPGGRMKLPETSYYRGVEEQAYMQRMAHSNEAMELEPFAQALVEDILDGRRGPIWRGNAATLIRFATWALPQWVIDKVCNKDQGLELVKRP